MTEGKRWAQASRPGGSFFGRQHPGSPGWPQQPRPEPNAIARFRKVRVNFFGRLSRDWCQFVKN